MEILSCVDVRYLNERLIATYELTNSNSLDKTQIRPYPGYGSNNKYYIPFSHSLGSNCIHHKTSRGPNGTENQYRIMLRYKERERENMSAFF